MRAARVVLALGCLAGCTRAPAPAVPLRGEALARAVDRIAEPVVARGEAVGLSIAVVRGDSVLFARGYGHADLARRVPCDEHTVYWIASVTKPFTAATVLRLAGEGRVDLARPLTSYLPEIGDQWGGVTLAHAINHTSGIPDFTIEADTRVLETGVPISRPYTAAWTKSAAPAFEPGEKWSYTNTAFWLAGMAAERGSGEPFDSSLARAIVRPLGLERTGFGFAPHLRGAWRVFQAKGDSVVDYRLINDHPNFTDGGLVSTVLELAAVARGMYGGHILGPETTARMTRPTPTRHGDVGYGLGTRIGVLGGHRKFGHTGGMEGTLATAAYYPDDSVAVVVLINTDGPADAPTIEAQVARAALGIPPDAMKPVPLTDAQVARLVGTFEMTSEGQTARYERFARNGKLEERKVAPGAEPFGLIHIGDGVFAVEGWEEGRLVSSLDDPSDTIAETWGGFFGAIAYRVRP